MNEHVQVARSQFRGRLLKYGSLAAAWVIFIGVSRQFVPQSSGALTGPTGTSQGLGTLRGRDYLVRVHAAVDGPRYDVRTLDGTLIRAGLAADELASEFPMIDARTMTAEPGGLHEGALMLVEPRE